MDMKSTESAIRDTLGAEVSNLLKSFIDKKVAEREIRFFNGKIVNNRDPLKEGRCQIRVFGKYTDDIPDEDIPWATPDFNFIGSQLGSFIVPPVDALVKVYFDNDDFYNPRYTTKSFEKPNFNFSAGIDTDYPDTMVFFETDRGEFFKINRLKGTTTYRHVSGVIIEFDADGNMTYSSESSERGSVTFDILGDLNLNVKGDYNLNATGNINMVSKSNATLKSLDTAIEGSTFLRMRFPGHATWFPNTLPNDPFASVPHGGIAAGQATLLSESPT